MIPPGSVWSRLIPACDPTWPRPVLASVPVGPTSSQPLIGADIARRSYGANEKNTALSLRTTPGLSADDVIRGKEWQTRAEDGVWHDELCAGLWTDPQTPSKR